MKIPMANIVLGKEELNNVVECVKSGWISSKGNYITQFEQAFADYHGMKYGVSCSSGTTALHLALLALGIKEGDEVIVPTLTFIATANAVRYCGATPVFVDSNEEYWCIDSSKIEKSITQRTKAIIPVHLYGFPADMPIIQNMAKNNGLFVVEDCAEAHGASIDGKKIGTYGNINCFSFYANKIMTSGEGGICLTNDKDTYEYMKCLCNHGMSSKPYWHSVIGFNYRMTALQAAVGLPQIKRLDKLIEKKSIIASWYAEGLSELIEQKVINPQQEQNWAKSVWWMYSFYLKDADEKERDKLIEMLSINGIESRPIFYPIHIMPPYNKGESLPTAEKIAKSGISLPSYDSLTKDKVEYICKAVKDIVEELYYLG